MKNKHFKGINNLLKKGFISGNTYEVVKHEIETSYKLSKIFKEHK